MMWKPSRRSVSIQQELSTDCNEWRVFYEKWEKENALEKVKPQFGDIEAILQDFLLSLQENRKAVGLAWATDN